MRILLVSQYFWPENFRVNDLVKSWVQRGHIVTVLTGVPNYPSGKVFSSYVKNPSSFSEFEGAQVYRVPMLPRGMGSFRLILNYLSFILGAFSFGYWFLKGKRFDVIFVFGPSPVTVALPALLLGKFKKNPVVFWVLDLWPETLMAVGVVRSSRLLRWVGYMVSFIYNRCTLILGQSQSFLASIAQYCDDKTKIRYFPNWAEDLFSMEDIQPAPELPLWIDGFTIVFAGNIGEAQDMPAILDAAEHLKYNSRIRWVIIGDGRKSDWLRSEISRRGLSAQVLQLGRFSLERMPSFYAHADALLVSLKRDFVFSLTIPGKVQSYLMAGIPLLGMLDGEGAAVINKAQAGLTCEAGDGAGLAKVVLELVDMSVDERKRLGINGLEYSQQNFDRAKLMDQLDAFLREAVALVK